MSVCEGWTWDAEMEKTVLHPCEKHVHCIFFHQGRLTLLLSVGY